MPDFRFWVPFNNDIELLKKLKSDFADGNNGNRIEGLYFSAPQEYFGSARVVSQFSLEDAKKVIDFCNKAGWKTDMLLNSSCEGADWYSPQSVSKTLFLAKKMKEAGLSGIILTNPIYIRKIKKENPDLKITASVVCEIDSVQRACFFEELGADAFVPDRDINRNPGLLKEIRDATGMEMTLMVNEGCLFRCPARNIHYNYTSHCSRPDGNKHYSMDFHSNYCIDVRKKAPEEIIKSPFILPQHLKHYSNITSSFKIVGRTMSAQWIFSTTKSYLCEKYDGNLLNILESAIPVLLSETGIDIPAKLLDDTFFKKVTSCNKNCTKCNYCTEQVKKVLSF